MTTEINQSLVQRKVELFKSLSNNIIHKKDAMFFYLGRMSSGGYSLDNPITVLAQYNNIIQVYINTKTGKLSFNGVKFDLHKLIFTKKGRSVWDATPLKEKIFRILSIGTPHEWIADYSRLYDNPYPYNFSSLKEFKQFLGMEHFELDDIISLMSSDKCHKYLDIMKLYPNQQAFINAYKTFYNSDQLSTLVDYHEMTKQLGIAFEPPQGKNKLHKLHDYATDLINNKKFENEPKEPCVTIEHIKGVKSKLWVTREENNKTFFDIWTERGLKFTHLNSIFLMKKHGAKQKHCLGSKATLSDMEDYSFFTFDFEGAQYNAQIDEDGEIYEFKGYRNQTPPIKLRQLVRDNINLEHNIITHKEVFDKTANTLNISPYGDLWRYAPDIQPTINNLAISPVSEEVLLPSLPSTTHLTT